MPKILVIDDEPNLRKIIRANLRASGYQVTVVSNGEEGLKSVKQSIPDLILLDFKMPGISGLDVLKELKSTSQLRNIPVILMTAFLRRTEENHALEMGADYLAKPFGIPELLGAVTHALEREK